jgi:Gas vesicle synthesis protein GvpL/GvpF
MSPAARRGRSGGAGPRAPRGRSGAAEPRSRGSGSARRLYVYALVDRKLPRLKLSGRTIEAVPVADLYAMAQRTDHAPVISEEALREQYDVVLELTQRTAAILPARFGSFVDHGELTRIVTLRHAQLTAALDQVRNREQMTVRLIESATAAGRAGRRMPASGGGPGARYLEERRSAAGYPLPDAATRLTAAVRSLIVADKAEPGEGNVRAMLYHLIERHSSAAYCRALAVAAVDVDFSVKVTGPWPPFAFVPELLG